MSAKGFIGPLRLPPERDLSIAFFYYEAVKNRQYAADVVADQLKPSEVFLFQTVQNSRQIAAMTAQIVIILHIPPLLEAGFVRGIVKLVCCTIPKQFDDRRSSVRIDTEISL